MIIVAERLSGLAFSALLYLAVSGCSVDGDCPAADCTDDAKIAADLLDRLNQQPALRGDLLRVQVINHVAYVRGLVDTEFERREVGTLTSATPGVIKVINATAVANSRD
jgi:osmotically-inducible protein OsmY